MRTSVRLAIACGFALSGALLATSADAQQAEPLFPHYHFAINAGANIADMTKTDGADPRTGLVVGGAFAYQFTRQFALMPEIYYSQKGVKGSMYDPELGETLTLKLKNDYIEVPVLARWSFTDRGTLQPFVVAGPSFAFSSSCKAEGSAGGVSASIKCKEIADLNTFDLGGIAGAGVEIPVGKAAVSLGARYTYGFQEVFDQSKSKNRTWSILLGYVF